MSKLQITVGASVDRSLTTAFQPLIESAKKAQKAIESESKRAGRAISVETKKGVDDAEAKFRELEKEIAGGFPKAVKTGTDAVKGMAKETTSSFAATKKSFNDLAREAESAMGRIGKAQKALAKEGIAPGTTIRNYGGSRVAGGGGLSSGIALSASQAFDASGGMKGVRAGLARSGRLAMGLGKATAGAAYGLGLDLAHGVGVDTSLQSMFSKNTDLESTATNVSNSGYIASDARNNQRVDPRQLMNEALSLGKTTGIDANEALEGLSKFTAKTGDLATGRAVMKDLAIFAKATGTSLEDMVDAAGDVSAALPEGADKAKGILSVMRSIAAQGKIGSVEVKDLATQMAKLTAAAGQIEGNVADNIVLLGAFAQEARSARGGSSSAPQAATSISGMINTFKTPARAKEFKAATGKDVFNENGMIRNPQELVMDALRAKGMDPLGFKKIFQNVAGGRAVEGFATVYRQAGGGEAGEKAVIAEFERLKNAAMADAEVMESFAAQMKTGKSQAEVFNNTMRETALRLQNDLLPAAIAMAPVFAQLATQGAGILGWLVGAEEKRHQANEAGWQADVESALKNSKKQIDNGEIVDGQTKINDQAIVKAKQLVGAKEEDAIRAQRDKTSDGWRTFTGVVDAVDQLNPLMWGTGGRGAKAHQAKYAAEDADIEKKKDEAAAAKEQLGELQATNKYMLDHMKTGVLKVRIVEPIPGGGGVTPPGVPKAGRQTSPDEK